MTTIYERAVEFVPEGGAVGLGSGRAASEFIRVLGERLREGLKIRGAVGTSVASENLARTAGVPLLPMEEAYPLDLAVDGADEWTPGLDLIKGYGRALLREKIVATSARKFVILVGPAKAVQTLGQRGKLPVEVLPLAVPLAQARIREMFGWEPVLWTVDGRPGRTDNGNCILDCAIPSESLIQAAAQVDGRLREVAGVVGTGIFAGMTDVLLEGDDRFELLAEHVRPGRPMKAEGD